MEMMKTSKILYNKVMQERNMKIRTSFFFPVSVTSTQATRAKEYPDNFRCLALSHFMLSTEFVLAIYIAQHADKPLEFTITM